MRVVCSKLSIPFQHVNLISLIYYIGLSVISNYQAVKSLQQTVSPTNRHSTIEKISCIVHVTQIPSQQKVNETTGRVVGPVRA